jgi:hypothetical protein
MKTKIILATFICLFGFQTANADIKKNTDSWLQRNGTQLHGNKAGDDIDNAQSDPSLTPLSDALPYLVLLAGGYALMRYRTIRVSKRIP